MFPMKDVPDSVCSFFWELKSIDRQWCRFTKSYNSNTLPMLRDHMLCIQQPRFDLVPEIFFERAPDQLECFPTIMRSQILDILEQKRLRPFFFDNSSHVKEKCALDIALEAMLPAERVFLGHTSE